MVTLLIMIDGRNLSLNKFFKKVIVSFLLLLVTVILVSCGAKFIFTKEENESFNQFLHDEGIEITSKEESSVEEATSNDVEEATSNDVGEAISFPVEETEKETETREVITKTKEKENVDRILFVGDNYPGKHGQNAYDNKGVSGLVDWYFKKQISTADLLVGNLETSLTDSVKDEEAYEKTYTFTTHSKYRKIFKELGFDVMSLANNHILDFGRTCLTDTINNLSKEGIGYIGAGINEEEANKPFIKEINGRKYAIFAATQVAPYDDWFATENESGVANGYTQSKLRANIRKYRSEVDKIIVFMHWGKELALTSDDTQKRLGRGLIDLGVDCVVGCHQHIPQEVEYYKGKPIVYGLGNFIFGVTDREMFMAELRFTYGKDENGNDIETMQLIMHPGKSGYEKVVYISNANDRMQQLVNLLVRSESTCNINEFGEVTPK